MASEPLHLQDSARPAAAAPIRAPAIHAVARDWLELAGAEAVTRWDALAQWASTPNPFFESWYLLPALEAFDPAGRVTLLCVEADGELAGLLPLSLENRYYHHPLPQWSSWMHGNCFLGAPLVARGLEKEFWRAVLGWADAHAGKALFLHLAQMPLDGPLDEALAAVLAEQKRPAALVHREERALLRSDLTPEAYLQAALSPKKRKELRRQYNRLAEEGTLRFERRRDAEAITAWTEAFLNLEASGWKGKTGHAMANDRETTALFIAALEGAAERGRLERLMLTLDGAPIAMLANFLTAPAAFSFKTAFDERYARFSPGVLLQRENLALLDRAGFDYCDSCASADHPMIDHVWRERRAIGRYSIGIGGPLRRAAFRALSWAEARTQSPAPSNG
ncbi:MAG: GNAT family N-acetyltransferase [Candidatus Andeanibacterium colombiense]|uniref:GNAT family N-acetyltransferase n=1 Tax=Candidatus Andeanibacterium colombiense TaxID=3121345 RepID=A0AAJ6BQQ5_9SPHN|nr:MAG: GNAT family N-acetyltransferase [Sphingomonadaceae bacterium]